MQNLLGRLFRTTRPSAGDPYQPATEDDLYYCYRLLLHRDPDPAGWAYWKEQIGQGRISLKSLTTSFLSSDDFLRAQLHTGYAELRLAAEQLQLVALDGFRMYIRRGDPIGEGILRHQTHEPDVTRLLRALLPAEGVFVDVGANIGYFSLLAASLVGPQGRVLAFEPNPQNGALIRSSITLNGFAQVDLHVKAVADQAQSFIMEVDGSNGRTLPFPTQQDGASDQGAAFPHSYLVQAVTLDEALPELSRLDLIKIDIEGAEPRALTGMARLLARYRPTIITEFFPSMLQSTSGVAPEAYLDALRRQGYELAVVVPDAIEAHPRSNEQILAALRESGGDHLDLLALPRPA